MVGICEIVQCDFSALISPAHFEEFCLPEIQRQCAMLDTSIYHLDGPDAIRHLDMILEIKDLDAVQWVAGAGKPGAKGWLPLLQRIQKAGKSVIVATPPGDVQEILSVLSPKGLMLQIEGRFDSPGEAGAFIDAVKY